MTRGVAIRRDRVWLRHRRGPTVPPMPTIALQPATETDRHDLERLAALDSAEPLHGDVLLGRVDGELRAALSFADGRVVADPFARSAQVVELLRTVRR